MASFEWPPTGGSGGGGGGTVTSVNVSGGTTGLIASGGPVISSGTITLSGTLDVANGGTGDTSLTLNGIMYGNGSSSPVGVTAAGTTGQILTATTGGPPSWQSPSAGSGTVTSVNVSGGGTGMTFSGGPVTTSGTITMAGTLAVAYGGTGDMTLALNGVLFGNGTSAVGVTAAGTTGQVLTATTGSAPTWASPATSGTVTSVALTVPSFLSVSGSPITSSGTLAVTLSGTALPVANGGTGDTALTLNGVVYGNGISAAGVTAAGTTGQVLTATTGSAPTWASPATSGTVTSVALSVPSFLSVSGSPITSSGTLAVTLSGTALPVANGGTGDTSLTLNGVVYGNGTSAAGVTAAGTTGQVLTATTGGAPTWQTGGGGVAGSSYCSVFGTTATSFAVAATWYDVTMDNELSKSGMTHSNTTNNARIQVATTGIYRITYALQFYLTTGAAAFAYSRLFTNGTTEVAGTYLQTVVGVNGYSYITSNSVIASLNASDYVTVQAGGATTGIAVKTNTPGGPTPTYASVATFTIMRVA